MKPQTVPLNVDTGGTWLVRVNARPSVVWDIVPWTYTVLKSAMQTVRPRRWTTVTAVVNRDQRTRRAAMETATPEDGSTRSGQR